MLLLCLTGRWECDGMFAGSNFEICNVSAIHNKVYDGTNRLAHSTPFIKPPITNWLFIILKHMSHVLMPAWFLFLMVVILLFVGTQFFPGCRFWSCGQFWPCHCLPGHIGLVLLCYVWFLRWYSLFWIYSNYYHSPCQEAYIIPPLRLMNMKADTLLSAMSRRTLRIFSMFIVWVMFVNHC